MSVDTPPEPERSQPLRREALLPNERNRGLGTVAVVCTMAGVASGLALATTLMAMQVADSMSVRSCPYRVGPVDVQTVQLRSDHGFLGVLPVDREGRVEIKTVVEGTPADALNLQPGDHVVSIDGAPIRTSDDLRARINGSPPGAQPSIVIERHGAYQTVRPTLAAWPVVNY